MEFEFAIRDYSGCPLIPALSLSKCCRDKGCFAGIRVKSVSVTKIGMYPYPGKNSGKKCRDKGYFAGIRGHLLY